MALGRAQQPHGGLDHVVSFCRLDCRHCIGRDRGCRRLLNPEFCQNPGRHHSPSPPSTSSPPRCPPQWTCSGPQRAKENVTREPTWRGWARIVWGFKSLIRPRSGLIYWSNRARACGRDVALLGDAAFHRRYGRTLRICASRRGLSASPHRPSARAPASICAARAAPASRLAGGYNAMTSA